MFTAQINQKLKSSNLDKSNDQVMNNDLLCRPKSNFWRKKNPQNSKKSFLNRLVVTFVKDFAL